MFGLGCTYFESHVLKKVKSTDDVDIGRGRCPSYKSHCNYSFLS